MLFFTCAGGPGGTYSGIGDRSGFLPTAIRNRLLRRALSFEPDAAIANGDHIYWDLHTWQGENAGQLSPSGPAVELRLLGVGVRRQQRGGDEGGGRPADRAGLRHGLPFDAHLLPAGRPRPLGERRGHRRHRQLPDPVVPASARARHAAALLSRVPARRPATGRPAVVGDERSRRPLGELRHAALRQPDRNPALRRAAHGEPLGPERGVHRPAGRELAARSYRGDRHAAPGPRAVEPLRVERRQVGRVVPGRARPRHRRVDDGHREGLLAGGLAAAARPVGGGDSPPSGSACRWW